MLDITNTSRFKIKEKNIRRAAEEILAEIEVLQKVPVSLVFAASRRIREINKRYRKIDKPTDVLSFEDLNEIVICPEVVKKQAGKANLPFEDELLRVLVHGILHLAGYDHEKNKKDAAKMTDAENKFFLKIKRS